MTVYERTKKIRWNLENIRFLYPPDDFTGKFSNEKMQARHKAMQDQKIKSILDQLENAENPIDAMCILNPQEHIPFLLNNMARFKREHCLEKAFLLLYYKKNTPFAAAGDYDTWKFIINNCDPDLLYDAGTPFPYDRVTAYRGSVTSIAKGLSWTVSRSRAAGVLERWKDKELGGGTVFSLEITRKDIVVYVEDEIRKEVILRPSVAESAEVRVITSL